MNEWMNEWMMNREGFGRCGYELLEVLFRMDWGKPLQTVILTGDSENRKRGNTVHQTVVCVSVFTQ
jgi:hypothetical protein